MQAMEKNADKMMEKKEVKKTVKEKVGKKGVERAASATVMNAATTMKVMEKEGGLGRVEEEGCGLWLILWSRPKETSMISLSYRMTMSLMTTTVAAIWCPAAAAAAAAVVV